MTPISSTCRITPFSDERGKTIVWNNVGMQTGCPIANIPMWIIGFAKEPRELLY